MNIILQVSTERLVCVADKIDITCDGSVYREIKSYRRFFLARPDLCAPRNEAARVQIHYAIGSTDNAVEFSCIDANDDALELLEFSGESTCGFRVMEVMSDTITAV